MGKLHKKVISALRRAWSDVEDALDDVEELGTVIGVVASPVFRRLDHEARQKKLRKVLKKSLTADEFDRVGPIATLTPEELHVKIS
ncbi:MAG TPA: hypothetical protein VGP94_04570 [Tepidisphaeraceae bacterium]|jgi:hypothetical protein|nr:hypothetical protein [Tepidisphaeraceae bacterium]